MKIVHKFRKETLRLFFSLVSVLMLVLLIISFFIFKRESNNAVERLEERENIKLDLQINAVIEDFKSVQRDVLFLRDLVSVNGLCSCIDESALHLLEKEFAIYLNQERQYDQLRLIGSDGWEKIRVQNKGKKAILISRDSLQYKGDRYYYKDIKELESNGLYFSKFDLNVENEKIEEPHRPMIRVGMKVLKDNGDFFGVILVNYLGQSLIDNLKTYNISTSSALHLLDSKGYLLISPVEANNWGFMNEAWKENVYAKFHPSAWQIIRSQKSGQFRDKDGLFTFNTLTFSQFKRGLGNSDVTYFSKDKYWKIVSYLSSDKLNKVDQLVLTKFSYLLALIIVLLFVLSFAISYYTVKARETKKQISDKNNFLSNVINSYSAPFYVLDAKTGKINLTNKAARELAIKEDDYFENNTFISEQGDIDKLVHFRNEIIRLKKHQRIEIEVKSKNAATRYLEINGFPVSNDNNEIIQFIEVINDKTVEKLSEKKFKDLLSSAPDGMVIINTTGVIEMVNKQAEKIFQYTAKELIGEKIEILIPGRFSNHVKYRTNYVKDPHARQMGGTTELLVGRKKNGEEFPTEISLSPIHTEDGILVASAIRDITDRKTVESEIRKLALVARYTNNSVLITDSTGRVEWVNEAFERITEYKLEEIKGKTAGQFLQGKDTSEEAKQSLRNAIKNKEALKVEIINYKKSGKAYWQLLNIQPISGAKDAELKFIGLGIDITDLKNKEDEVLKLNNELEERVKDRTRKLETASEAIIKNREELKKNNIRLESAFSSGGYAWWELDLTTKKVDSSPLRYEVLGYRLDEIEPTFDWWLSMVHPDDKETVKQNLEDYINGKVDSYDTDYRLRHKNGEYTWFHDKGKITSFTTDNEVKKIIGTVQDINIIKKAEEEIIKAKNAAESSNKAKSEFLANMSHEIRTPMNAIIGFSEQLSNTIKEDKQLSQINSIRSSGKNLLRIINDILDLSKIEAGKLDIDPVPVSLAMVTSEIGAMFAQKVEEKGIAMHIHLSDDLPETLLLDEVRIRQILFNLIGNAVKFTEEGAVTLSIESEKCETEEKEVDLTILVKDTGIGISPKQQKLIFDPFNQKSGQSVAKYGGTGLGLSITQKLVEKMGGNISVESEVGSGSLFKVVLNHILVLDIHLSSNKKAFDTSKVVFEPATVLIVDDNADNRDLIVDLLNNSALTILQAENGAQAIDIAKEKLPDLILMDLRMPVMDGLQATKILSQDKITSAIPVIALTASIKSLDEINSLSGFFDEYILKPLDIENFFYKIGRHLTYKIMDDADAEAVSKVEYKFSDEQLEAFPDFIKMLETDFIPKYEEAVKNQVINEMEQFGIDLLKASEQINCKTLIDYCTKIATYVNSFEFEKLNKTLKDFPKVIASLKQRSK